MGKKKKELEETQDMSMTFIAEVGQKSAVAEDKLDDVSGTIDIKEGRHPVIEKMLSSGNFVPNDTYMNKGSDRLRNNYRTKYGRKIYIYEASSINNPNGTSRKFCTSKWGENKHSR